MAQPQNYISYHFTVALPEFIKSRPGHLVSTLEFLNTLGLLKNLFSPYRRLTAGKKTSFSERLSFDLISTGIGATVRLVLIIAGFVAFAFIAVFEVIAIFIYILPLLSWPKYATYKNETFFEKEAKDPKKFIKKLLSSHVFKTTSIFFEPNFQKVFDNLPTPKEPQTSPANFLKILPKNWQPLQEYLERESINAKEFNLLVKSVEDLLKNPKKSRPRPIGQMLTFGYTNTLDRFGTELTNQNFPDFPGKNQIFSEIEKVILRKQANNLLLVGEVGVGRHNTLETLSSQIAKGQRPGLKNKRIILLDTILLLGTSKNLIEIKSNFESLLKEAKSAGNIILAINQIDRISSTEDGRIDLSEVITTVQNDNALPIIGITTPEDFNRFIRPNTGLLRLFEKIDLEEPTKEETIAILINISLATYRKQGISTAFAAILEIVEKSDSLIQNQMQPEKSILLLEDSVTQAQNSSKKQVNKALVDTILSQKTKVPLGKINKKESIMLQDLEAFLHRRIIGQDEAITEIAKAMRRARTGLEKNQRPIGSFLFLGPTGVGKTETAKALADAYFGAERKMIRLDMTEFQNDQSVERLIGSTQTKTPGQLTSMVLQNPYGLLLLDEFEKASHAVQNLFLQILDEGRLTDAFGKKVSFANTIIIATSNAGSEFIREEVSKSSGSDPSQGPTLKNSLSKSLINFVLQKGIFNPELINRFDAAVVYLPLTEGEAQKVAKLMLLKLAAEIKDSKNITLEITDNLAQTVAQKGYNKEFGARPIRRLVQDKIEDGIAKMVISGEAKNGTAIPVQTLLQFVS